jgi:hypothetical protein
MADERKRPACGHSACVQNWIETGEGLCVAPIVCPKCEASPPQLAYLEMPASAQRVNINDDGSITLGTPSYDHNDAANPTLACRACQHSFPVPQAFYDADPWG